MADVYIVVIHKGPGEVGGAFTTLGLAQAYIQTRPPCNWSVYKEVIDGPVEANMTVEYNSQFTPTRMQTGGRWTTP